MVKKIISAMLCVIIPFGGMIMLTSCDTVQNNYTLQFVTTPIQTDADVSTIPCDITLSDTTFSATPSSFSKDLSLLSLTLSSAAYSYTYALDNLETLGFEHFGKFNYSDEYNSNAVGTIIASKKLYDTTIVAIIFRGTFEKEWFSNFDIGRDVNTTKVHSGFNKAREFALKKLDMYIANYGIDRDHCKFLVTGHSRGGAVANLVSKSLIDTYGPSNVYAYTFATPNTTTDENASDNRYAGIFNFINPEDFIAYIPLKSWGFTKYGTTIAFPKNNSSDTYNEKLSKASQYYESLKGRELKTFGGTKQMEEFINTAFKLAPSITDYYDTKYEIAGLQLSVHEYMTVVANVLTNENIISNGLILMSSDGTAFEPFSNYIMSGMETESDGFSLDYDNSMIAYAHTAETYLAWMYVYTEDM